jgi:O-acetyl-ADP-ribose deacetylase (regulator of RNase III)
MIYEVEGDIMLTRAQVIVNDVGVGDPMTRGLSRVLNERYPVMVEDYREWCEQNNPEPGEVWLWEAADKTQIINLITHEGDEDPTRVRRPNKIAVNRCLRRLAKMVIDQRIKSLAMPKIASGDFGLDWIEVRGMMDSQLSEVLAPIFIYVVELEGQVASEPGM